MSLRLPSFKLLEITLRSAHDLPPVSKLLRTYAVAWLQPDHKCSTRIDREGHTNPTWNDKFVFMVDDKFLLDDSSNVTIEIYSVSWLRDIPIGTVCVPINDLIPPSSWFKQNSSARFVNLKVTRPSGHLQGVLNIGVNLVSSSTSSHSMPLSSEMKTGALTDDEETAKKQTNHNQQQDKKMMTKSSSLKMTKSSSLKLQRSQSQKTVSFKEEVDVKEFKARNGSVTTDGSEANGKGTNGSICSSSYMRPLPSEVAAGLQKGLYSTTSGDDIGSSIFENWTVDSVAMEVPPLMVKNWMENITPSPPDKKHSRKNSGDGGGKQGVGGGGKGEGGLLSCFGIICGYECNIICGKPKSPKKNNIKKRYGKSYHADQNLPRFYMNS